MKFITLLMRSKFSTILIHVLINTLIIVQVQCANILGLFSYSSKSHMNVINPIIDELLQRGHKITVVTSISRKIPSENYTEIYVEPVEYWPKVKEQYQFSSLGELRSFGGTGTTKVADSIINLCIENCFADPAVQELFHSTNQKFDLVLMNQFFQEAFLIFAHKFNVPVVYITTLNSWQYLSQIMGYMQPWAHIPHQFLQYDDKMNFVQRCVNVWTSVYELFFRHFKSYPNKESLIRKYLVQSNETFPNIREMEKRVSLVLINGYTPLNFPGPKPSGVVEIGGVQIRRTKPLNSEIQEFLDGAKDGAIYFSFGSNVNESDLPDDKYKSILKLLGGLKQRILWKWETTSSEPIPKNIMMRSWFPQTDILVHPSVKLFITHAGSLSVQESVYAGVPILTIPFFADQYVVAKIAETNGYGLSIQFNNLTDISLKWGINEILNNSSYAKVIQRLSTIFRDRPRPAIDEAMYWIEYVIRHKGAPHLRLSSEHLSWFSYFLLDVTGAFILFVIMLSLLFWYIIGAVNKRFKRKFKKINTKKIK